MAERNVLAYRRLFEVRVLHHYWLDEGATVFDSLAADKQLQRLLSYDRRAFLAVVPSPATVRKLQGLQAIFKDTALGWVVVLPASAQVPPETELEFILTVEQADFFNYTALTLPERRIFELYHPPTKKILRYKENVPLLSNLRGTARGTGTAKALYLSTGIPALTAGDKVEALGLVGAALVQLTGDNPGGATRQLSPQAADMPVFMHQADAPVIVPPAGLEGTPPARGIELTAGMPNQVFALVRIAAVHPTDPDFSCTDGGLAKANAPVFQIRLLNRAAVWRYFNKSNPALAFTDAGLLPLTRFGNAGTKQKPSAGHVKADKSGTKITRLVSEIYE